MTHYLRNHTPEPEREREPVEYDFGDEIMTQLSPRQVLFAADGGKRDPDDPAYDYDAEAPFRCADITCVEGDD